MDLWEDQLLNKDVCETRSTVNLERLVQLAKLVNPVAAIQLVAKVFPMSASVESVV